MKSNYKKNYKFEGYNYLIYKKIFQKYLKKQCNLLDIGCGNGKFAECLNDSTNYTGYDFAKNNIKLFKENYYNKAKNKSKTKIVSRNRKIYYKDLNSSKSKLNLNKFNFIILSHVLEHLHSPYTFMLKLKKSPKNSILYLSLPNLFSLIHLKYKYFTEDNQHLYAFSDANVYKFLKDCDYTILEKFHNCEFSNFPVLLNQIILIISKLLPNFFLKLITWETIYICKKN
jgi:2-polyprenyl-3-methyl-5-hydroxy-6-metoxy-1,4-benzoquinol methylase